MTISEAARRLGVSRKVVYRLIKQGKLHPAPPNPLYVYGPARIPSDEVEAVLREHRPDYTV